MATTPALFDSMAQQVAQTVEKRLADARQEADRIRAEGQRILTVCKKPDIEEMFARVRKLRGAIPRDFKFDRDEANER